jgi:aryl carrier-like protein
MLPHLLDFVRVWPPTRVTKKSVHQNKRTSPTDTTVFNFEPEPRFNPGLNPGLNLGSGLRFSTRVRVWIFQTRVEPGLKLFLFSLLKGSYYKHPSFCYQYPPFCYQYPPLFATNTFSHIQLSDRGNLICLGLLSLFFMSLFSVGFSLLRHTVERWWVQCLSECNTWGQCLRAMPGCNAWVQCLSAMTECNNSAS